MSDPNAQTFQPPPPPYSVPGEPPAPVMSEGATLTGIFFEPGSVFESFRARPRFILATVIMVIAFLAFAGTFYRKYGYETVMRANIEGSPQADKMSPEQKEKGVQFWTGPIGKAINFAIPILGFPIFFAIGGALYLLGTLAMGKKAGYWQAVSVWVYSSFPPTVITMLLNIVLVFIKPVEGSELVRASRGLVRADLGFLISQPDTMPVLATLLGSFDVFAFYGLFLAALGLRKITRLTSGSAWGIVLTFWLIGLLFRLGFAAIGGKAL
jgi:hypothetical protein